MQEILEEVRLLHDSQELLFVHLAVSITVCFINHLLELFVCHALAELLRKNSSSFTSPSPSRSASSTISWSSSSVMRSPSSFARTPLRSPRRLHHGLLHQPSPGALRLSCARRAPSQELLFVHLAVSITVCFINHLLELFVCHALAELLRNPFQVFEGDLARLVIVEEAESLQDLIFGVTVEDLVCHHLQELLIA